MRELIQLLKCDSKDITEAIMKMEASEVDAFAEQLHTIAKFLLNDIFS